MAYSAGLGETPGIAAHPLFAVCYEWPVSQPPRQIAALQPHAARLVHAQHDLVIHRPPRAGDTVRTSARIIAVEQRPPGAFVVYRFATVGADGAPITTSDFGALYRGVKLDGPARNAERFEDPPAHAATLAPAGDFAVAATAAHVYTECARRGIAPGSSCESGSHAGDADRARGARRRGRLVRAAQRARRSGAKARAASATVASS